MRVGSSQSSFKVWEPLSSFHMSDRSKCWPWMLQHLLFKSFPKEASNLTFTVVSSVFKSWQFSVSLLQIWLGSHSRHWLNKYPSEEPVWKASSTQIPEPNLSSLHLSVPSLLSIPVSNPVLLNVKDSIKAGWLELTPPALRKVMETGWNRSVGELSSVRHIGNGLH